MFLLFFPLLADADCSGPNESIVIIFDEERTSVTYTWDVVRVVVVRPMGGIEKTKFGDLQLVVVERSACPVTSSAWRQLLIFGKASASAVGSINNIHSVATSSPYWR